MREFEVGCPKISCKLTLLVGNLKFKSSPYMDFSLIAASFKAPICSSLCFYDVQVQSLSGHIREDPARIPPGSLPDSPGHCGIQKLVQKLSYILLSILHSWPLFYPFLPCTLLYQVWSSCHDAIQLDSQTLLFFCHIHNLTQLSCHMQLNSKHRWCSYQMESTFSLVPRPSAP